eukprot:gene9121-9881_t
MSLQLSLNAGNQQVTANLSWHCSQPQGVIDYIILYYASGSGQIHSMSTQSLSVVITGLTNDIVYNFYAAAYQSGSTNGQRLSETPVQQAIPATLPTAPSNLAAIVSTNGNVISGEVDLSWSASATDSHYPILNYNVYQSSDNVNFTLIAQPNTLSYNVMNLQNGSTFHFAVSGVSILGEGAKCASVSAYPSGLASAPQNLAINYDPNASSSQQIGYQSVDISYAPPLSNGGNSVTGYVIEYSLDQTFASGVTTVNNATTLDTVQDANLMVPFADMRTSTAWYFFRVCAVTSLGNGAFCAPATIMPTANPNQVQNLAASNLNELGQHEAGCVTLSWGYPVDASVPLLGYIITYLDSNSDPQSLYIFEPDRTPAYTIRQLENGFEYVFNVMAFNILNIGESSNVSIIPSTVPDAPILSITGHSGSSISMSWSTPADEGNTITGFCIFRSTDGMNFSQIASNVQGNAYTDSDHSLVLGQTYFYLVCATNANGNGIMSNIVSEYPSRAPDSVQNISVVASNTHANGQQLTISWDAPISNGGSPITEYQILAFQGNTPLGFISTGLNRTFDLSVINSQLLQNGVVYGIVIRDFNRDGIRDTSYNNPPSAFPMGLPDTPSGLAVQTGNQQMMLSWNLLNVAPGLQPNDEGSAVTQYNIIRDSITIDSVGSSTNSYVDSNAIENGVVHQYQILAQNANGQSALCAAVSQSASSAPDVPANFQAVHGNAQAQLSWNLLNSAPYPAQSPSDEGRPILLYSIYDSDDNMNFNLATTVSGSSNMATIGNLVNGNAKYFKVSSTNSQGSSALSLAISCVPSSSPAVPQSVTIYPYDSGVEISWEAPANDQSGNPSGGLAFTYNAQIADVNGGVAYTASNITNPLLNINGLNDNQQYVLTLYANNGVDTNYNIYSANFTVVPNPITITSLQMTSQSQQQINLQFVYNTAMYSISEYLLNVVDMSQQLCGYAVIQADSQSIIAGNQYTYNFAINPATVNMPQLQLSDQMLISIYAINNLGEVSAVSNVLQIN